MKKTNENAITLIALVVTIVVLLILAGVSISLVLGNNGLISNAKQSGIETEISKVAEQLVIAGGEFDIDAIVNDKEGSTIEYLKSKGIIDENNVIDIQKLLNTKSQYGNGTDSDIFQIQGNKLVYINKNKEVVAQREIEMNTTETKASDFITEWTVNANDTIVLPIAYAGNNGSESDNDFSVDWGDGTSVENVKGAPTQRPSHTYSKAGTYRITISGKCHYFTISSIYSEYPEVCKKITKLVSWGEIQANEYGFEQAENLSGAIPSPTKNTFAKINADGFEYMFLNCKNITSIPSNLFDNIPENITSLKGVFGSCINLKEIPENIFKNFINVTNFKECFECDTGLKKISKDLFKYNTKVESFEGVFTGCENLESIPNELFANNTNVTNFKSAFRDCSSLTVVPEKLFDNNQKVTNFRLTFADDYNLTSVPKLWERTTENLDGTGCFYGCEKVNTSGIDSDKATTWFYTSKTIEEMDE